MAGNARSHSNDLLCLLDFTTHAHTPTGSALYLSSSNRQSITHIAAYRLQCKRVVVVVVARETQWGFTRKARGLLFATPEFDKPATLAQVRTLHFTYNLL